MKAVLSVLILLLLISQPCALAKEKKEPDLQKRMALYHKTEAATHIPWYVFAAVDQYEINIRKNR
ncbi:peptidase M23, partial [Staphylococcus aureus]|nr:peptidase M23 [Staphylococcus aureus]